MRFRRECSFAWANARRPAPANINLKPSEKIISSQLVTWRARFRSNGHRRCESPSYRLIYLAVETSLRRAAVYDAVDTGNVLGFLRGPSLHYPIIGTISGSLRFRRGRVEKDSLRVGVLKSQVGLLYFSLLGNQVFMFFWLQWHQTRYDYGDNCLYNKRLIIMDIILRNFCSVPLGTSYLHLFVYMMIGYK